MVAKWENNADKIRIAAAVTALIYLVDTSQITISTCLNRANSMKKKLNLQLCYTT